MFVDRRVVEPRPAAVRTEGRVGDQDMGVELGVSCPRGAVRVGGAEQAVPIDEGRATLAASRPTCLALHVGQRLGDGGAVGIGHLAGDRVAAERPGQGDRLRRGEGEVETGDGLPPRCRLQPEWPAGDRIAAGQHARQRVGIDPPVEPEVGGRGADPVALRLTVARVVVLRGFGNLLGVVVLLAGAELPDRDHQQGCPSGVPDPSRGESIHVTAGARAFCTGCMAT